MSNMLSIIIPTFNEEANIADILTHIKELPGNKEIILVDGGSEDRTVEKATGLFDRLVISKKGRGKQLNAGAAEARGDIYLFLHSDSRLDRNALLAIEKALQDPAVAGGCFQLKIDDDSYLLRFISYTSNLRAKFLKIIFGDQGIFVRGDIFQRIGGYPEIDLMEDWEFSRILSSVGKLAFLEERIYTSARRFKKYGILRTILLMQKIKLLYLMGVAPTRLNDIYRKSS
ncbi:MAG: TIGR04283 family arsenosugar biosynthesis glycosyltransferase [Halanaerobiales bacterium]